MGLKYATLRGRKAPQALEQERGSSQATSSLQSRWPSLRRQKSEPTLFSDNKTATGTVGRSSTVRSTLSKALSESGSEKKLLSSPSPTRLSKKSFWQRPLKMTASWVLRAAETMHNKPQSPPKDTSTEKPDTASSSSVNPLSLRKSRSVTFANDPFVVDEKRDAPTNSSREHSENIEVLSLQQDLPEIPSQQSVFDDLRTTIESAGRSIRRFETDQAWEARKATQTDSRDSETASKKPCNNQDFLTPVAMCDWEVDARLTYLHLSNHIEDEGPNDKGYYLSTNPYERYRYPRQWSPFDESLFAEKAKAMLGFEDNVLYGILFAPHGFKKFWETQCLPAATAPPDDFPDMGPEVVHHILSTIAAYEKPPVVDQKEVLWRMHHTRIIYEPVPSVDFGREEAASVLFHLSQESQEKRSEVHHSDQMRIVSTSSVAKEYVCMKGASDDDDDYADSDGPLMEDKDANFPSAIRPKNGNVASEGMAGTGADSMPNICYLDDGFLFTERLRAYLMNQVALQNLAQAQIKSNADALATDRALTSEGTTERQDVSLVDGLAFYRDVRNIAIPSTDPVPAAEYESVNDDIALSCEQNTEKQEASLVDSLAFFKDLRSIATSSHDPVQIAECKPVKDDMAFVSENTEQQEARLFDSLDLLKHIKRSKTFGMNWAAARKDNSEKSAVLLAAAMDEDDKKGVEVSQGEQASAPRHEVERPCLTCLCQTHGDCLCVDQCRCTDSEEVCDCSINLQTEMYHFCTDVVKADKRSEQRAMDRRMNKYNDRTRTSQALTYRMMLAQNGLYSGPPPPNVVSTSQDKEEITKASESDMTSHIMARIHSNERTSTVPNLEDLSSDEEESDKEDVDKDNQGEWEDVD